MAFGRLQNFLSGRRKDEHSPPPHFLALRSSKAYIITTLCAAVFSDMFLYGVIVPVVPFSLTARAGVPADNAQHWVSVLLAVYGAALLVSSPIAGWYADNTESRRLPLLFGLVALAGATVLLCLAKSVALMIVGRLMQGIAAGIVWTVGMALMVDTVGQKDIGQSLGYVGISMSVGVIVAPLIGGAVYQRSGYYAVYYVCFGLLALDITMRLMLVEQKIAAQWDDVVGIASKPTDETTDESIPSEEANDTDADSPAKISSAPDINRISTPSEVPDKNADPITTPNEKELITSPLPTADSSTPLPPKKPTLSSRLPPVITLLASRRLLAALWGCLIQASVITSFDSVLPLFVADTFHWTSVGAGLVFLPIMIPGFAAPLSGAIADKYGPRWISVAGFIIPVPCLVLLRLVTHDSTSQKVLLCALLAIMGAALAAVMPPLMAEITYIVEAKEVRSPGVFGVKGAYAQAYGLFVMSFAAGCLIGPIWAGFVVAKSGWGTMGWSLALLSFAGALPVAIWTGGLITRVNAKSGKERAVGMREVKGVKDDGEAGVVADKEVKM